MVRKEDLGTLTLRGRPIFIQAIAGLLTFYAMAGMWLAMMMAGNRDPRFHWIPLAIGGLAFGASAGVAALAVWRREPRAPGSLMVCAAVGATLCVALPLAVRGGMVSRDSWRVAIAGGLLFAAFLLIAARYVRLLSGSEGDGR